MRLLKRMHGALAAALWPPHCLLCGEAGAGGRDLCAACHRLLPWNVGACVRCALPILCRSGFSREALGEHFAAAAAPTAAVCAVCRVQPPPYTTTVAAFRYSFPLDRLLPRFKFHADLAAGRLVAELMLAPLAAAARPQALLPLPLHRSRLRERGFDQALELARPLAAALRLPLRTDALQRVRATAAQTDLGASQRRTNLRGAFAVSGPALPAHVALVDDVMTTGATLAEAARMLRAAGVERIDVWVAARALPPGADQLRA